MAADSARPRSGFSLFVVVVMFAVAAVLATVVLTTLSGDNDQDRIERAADVLHRLAAEIDTTNGNGCSGQSFACQVGVWPGKLSQLYTAITSSDLQCNGTGYHATQISGWRGPYHLVPIGTSGHNIAPGFFANDALTQVSKSDEAITIPNVSLADAQALDLFVDKALSATSGIVTYSGTTTQTVLYHITGITC